MKSLRARRAFIATVVVAASWSWVDGHAADSLTIVMIRHAEKPTDGDNLSCQGQNRSLQLPSVLFGKFGKPDYAYVPVLKLGVSSKHARMFQTVTPFAIKHHLTLNSRFDEADVTGVAADVRKRRGLVLMVWQHSQLRPLARALGVAQPPDWKDEDFDGIWIVSYSAGRAVLTTDSQGISPAEQCSF